MREMVLLTLRMFFVYSFVSLSFCHLCLGPLKPHCGSRGEWEEKAVPHGLTWDLTTMPWLHTPLWTCQFLFVYVCVCLCGHKTKMSVVWACWHCCTITRPTQQLPQGCDLRAGQRRKTSRTKAYSTDMETLFWIISLSEYPYICVSLTRISLFH